MNKFYISQVFNEEYPPEVAIWCKNNNAYIAKENSSYIIKQVEKDNAEELILAAKILLNNADRVVIRTLSKGMAMPIKWIDYMEMLREVVRGNLAILPTTPNYPEGS